MIVLADGQARSTSRAAEQQIDEQVGECYHHACYAQARGPHPRCRPRKGDTGAWYSTDHGGFPALTVTIFGA
jgi:hypothetical protein